ncbi:NRDE family protein [Niabella insulamsoli]|uniref:NRDE family protein n=1 Tax=Niabella insulamsoli TaxID=3144874 RepID=UPI0031FBEE97
MCTVTYIKHNKGVYLTSNRDESLNRPAASHPQWYSFSHGRILFPKDERAGGSWIGVHENQNICILLNGAANAHQPSPPYRRSRGLILLDILNAGTLPTQQFEQIDLQEVEPFTLIILEKKSNLYQCRWDGRIKSRDIKNSDQNHIWSSSTLYKPEYRALRKNWFEQWLAANHAPDTAEILHFHTEGGKGDPEIDLRMHRPQHQMQTVSISHISLHGPGDVFHYFDLIHQTKTSLSI